MYNLSKRGSLKLFFSFDFSNIKHGIVALWASSLTIISHPTLLRFTGNLCFQHEELYLLRNKYFIMTIIFWWWKLLEFRAIFFARLFHLRLAWLFVVRDDIKLFFKAHLIEFSIYAWAELLKMWFSTIFFSHSVRMNVCMSYESLEPFLMIKV